MYVNTYTCKYKYFTIHRKLLDTHRTNLRVGSVWECRRRSDTNSMPRKKLWEIPDPFETRVRLQQILRMPTRRKDPDGLPVQKLLRRQIALQPRAARMRLAEPRGLRGRQLKPATRVPG